ncbi:MAG: glycosyltransferase, partial [Chloroflexi bacterium]
MFLTIFNLSLEAIYIFIILVMTVQAIFNIRLRLFIWEVPEHAWLNHAPTVYLEPCLSFSILLPARHEEEVFRETLQKVYGLNYPKELMQILAICREDDPGTIAEAQAKIDELGDPNVQLVVFNDQPINKQHGMNLALQVARGDIVTIFDAEDEPHPDILNIINTTMLKEDLDVIQSGVQLMNHNSKWFCFLNVLEYFFWFKSSMHFFARVGMTPLGGINLSKARMRIIYDDEFVTREETPHTIEQFVKQRTRWNQGFIQILFKGEWLKLRKFSQRMLAFYVLTLPELQAFFALMVPASLVMFFFVKLPLWFAMLTFLPLYCCILAAFI